MTLLEIGNFEFSTQNQIGKGFSSVVYKGMFSII